MDHFNSVVLKNFVEKKQNKVLIDMVRIDFKEIQDTFEEHYDFMVNCNDKGRKTVIIELKSK